VDYGYLDKTTVVTDNVFGYCFLVSWIHGSQHFRRELAMNMARETLPPPAI